MDYPTESQSMKDLNRDITLIGLREKDPLVEVGEGRVRSLIELK